MTASPLDSSNLEESANTSSEQAPSLKSPLDLPAMRARIERAKERPVPPGLAGILALDALDLIARVEVAEGEVLEEIGNRDAWEEKLTKLVYSLATVEEVGEWSSGNDIADNLIDHIGGKVRRLERRAEAAEAKVAAGLTLAADHPACKDAKYGCTCHHIDPKAVRTALDGGA